ncbi:MAG: F420H2 dehydrogenase subunit F [candidate division BRC1 bacterium ADurb.BinA292]|nr:MAG: F420H2 dehydrogenase subunit F [candidate division BRC1 bacterium ADurb.BinA292]
MPARNLQPVINHSMCIGCGACAAADPSVPAVQVDFEFLQRRLFPGQPPGPLGVLEKAFLAQSRDYQRNLNSSSGGLIKELLHLLIRRDDIDGVVCLQHVDRLVYEPRLLTDPDQIDRLGGSIYHNISFANALRLLRENTGRYVLVAIPCQLEGIYSYIFKQAPELRERIAFTIGLLCGWTFSHHALRAICDFKGIPFDSIEMVTYRGGGPVGPLRIQAGGRLHKIHRRIDLDYQVAFDRSFNLPRCHLCINHGNFLADIVVGDAWLPSTVRTRTGISLLLCRARESVARVEELAAAGRIVHVEATADDVLESQTRRSAYGDFAYALADCLKSQGQFVPDMTGPNRVAAHLADPDDAASYHRAYLKHRRLQFERKYRALRLRKLTVGLPQISRRYFRWFFIRLLKIDRVFRRERKPVPKHMEIFR